MNTSVFRLDAFIEGRLANFEEIVWLSGDGNYTHIHLCNGTSIVSSKNLNLLSNSLLEENNFLRIHKRYLINMNRIAHYDKKKNTIYLPSGQALLVARRRKRILKAWLKKQK